VRAVRFGSVTVAYDGDVLEPRPWTLEQAAWAIDLAAGVPDGPILELCAGVGHIGLVVAKETGRPIVQVDADPHACDLAVRNARAAGVASDVRCGDLGAVLDRDERVPLVLADPPYVPRDDTARHPDDPRLAIDGGEDGLELAERCVAVAADHLVPGGALVLQLRDLEQVGRLASVSRRLTLDAARDVDGHGAVAVFRPSSA
jgi:methylase of polypeptide subunit release factors